MKVAVALTDAAVLGDAFEIDGATVPERYRSYELNEWDEYALEAAVQLVEAGEADEVVTVTIGPERTEETIRKALAKGADRAIRVWDEALADRTFLDTAAKSRLLAAVLDDEAPGLVLTGVQTSDDMGAATGVMTASRLGYAWAAIVTDVTVDPDAGHASVRRELEGGVDELVDLELPALCTVQTGINEPRYASLRGIRMAQRTEIDVRALAALGLDDEAIDAPVALRALRRPTSGETAERYEGSPTETTGRLAAFLRQQGVGT